jgi:hypothetical protein
VRAEGLLCFLNRAQVASKSCVVGAFFFYKCVFVVRGSFEFSRLVSSFDVSFDKKILIIILNVELLPSFSNDEQS